MPAGISITPTGRASRREIRHHRRLILDERHRRTIRDAEDHSPAAIPDRHLLANAHGAFDVNGSWDQLDQALNTQKAECQPYDQGGRGCEYEEGPK